MAVYTDVSAEELGAFLARFNTGKLVSSKGIAEGVSNSNFLVETETDRFILTLYERRINLDELPWFIHLMEHLADAGLPVPRPIRDKNGEALQQIAGKTACLIQYLSGVSVSKPTADQAYAAGAALARLHLAGQDFPLERPNSLSLANWQDVAADLGPRLDEIEPGLHALVQSRVAAVAANWPTDLPRGVIHADLFPDNVLMLGDTVTGLIDLYFACTDFWAYDLAVLQVAWAFAGEEPTPIESHVTALMAGYASVRPLTPAETAAFPLLAQGACLRFLLSRAQDWLEPTSDAMVQRKNPRPIARRLEYYAGLHG